MQWFHRRSTKCGRGRRRRPNSARISHPPPFRRVTKKADPSSSLTSSIDNTATSNSEFKRYLFKAILFSARPKSDEKCDCFSFIELCNMIKFDIIFQRDVHTQLYHRPDQNEFFM